MQTRQWPGSSSVPRVRGLAPVLAVVAALSCGQPAAGGEAPKLVVVVYPTDYDGAPGIILVNRALRSTFASEWSGHVDIHNEYVNTNRLRDAEFMQAQVILLKRKYAGRKVDLVIAGLSAGLDFAVKFREELFPGVPIVFVAVDEREVKARRLPPDVIGVPIRMDLGRTLDVALRLHPATRRVFVITGSSPFDAEWEAEARRTFRVREDRLEFVYLTGLTVDELLGRVADLPEQSLVYFIHLHQDATGKPFYSAEALERLAAKANAPIYGHVETYVGRGAVGGHVFRFEESGSNAARLGLRIFSGEKPESIPVSETSENAYLFDWRQLRRWGISEESLPPGSVVLFREPTFWDAYKWHVVGGAGLCVAETLLIAWLLTQRARRRRAEDGLRTSQRELQLLAGRLLAAQEEERRRIARELHDDLNQSLALLSVELDVLAGSPPESPPNTADRVRELSARVKELSSSVHDLSHQLHPSKLEQLGLVAAVRGLCLELAHAHGLEAKFTHDGVPGHIPADVALCLYRIVQEALRNVVKHSGTRHATVELSGTGGAVRLRVADDGVGFDPSAVNGLGLVSMRERLHIVGGEVVIDSRPSGGTRLDVRVLIPAPAVPDAAEVKPEPAPEHTS